MSEPTRTPLDRRRFIQRTVAVAGLTFGCRWTGLGKAGKVAIVTDPDDAIASEPPSAWAVEELRGALESRGIEVSVHPSLDRADPGALSILVAGDAAPHAQEALRAARVSVPAVDEGLAVVPGRLAEKDILLACGHDVRGLVYAVLELADRVRLHTDPGAALRPEKAIVEQPANRIRCISRAFCSDVEDKPWFNDREMWPEYLTMLATQRFNRFNLTLGLAYDFTRNVSDCYFHFAYPFLLAVPGYDVRAVGLADEERDHNLRMLRFISEQAAARALQFNLGLWTHAYEWTDSPNPNFTHEGLNAENHAPYCRDALRMLLQECPGITGVTIRTHGESGVAEGRYDLWRTIFDGVATCGRQVEIDLHAKGTTQEILDIALDTGMPVVAGPKYWAEHMGLPYHQTAIRELERRPRTGGGFFSISGGARRFLRYGYGDLLKENRRYGVLHRMFPGARRVLLWGDPLTAAAFGRASHFCDSDGVDFMEPLYFKGRRGSGVPGGRCSYADASLEPRWDWQKFLYTYRVWGRHLYNPDVEPEVWRRSLSQQLGAAAPAAEEALGRATRLLQIICTVHGVSAAHNRYWPEMYTNMSIVGGDAYNPYGDTPEPKRFGTVSPFDPQLFLTIDETASEMLTGERSGKYSQIEAAQWLEDLAAGAAEQLALAEQKGDASGNVELRRLAIDTRIQIGLGRFFASKIRSAVLWAVYTGSGDRRALESALEEYRKARSAWGELAEAARGVYMTNVSYGQEPYLSGHWIDRIPAIDEDIARMAKALEEARDGSTGGPADAGRVERATQEATGRPDRSSVPCAHEPPSSFQPGQTLGIRLSLPGGDQTVTVRMHYRHVNQAESYETTSMVREGNALGAEIPARYTDSPYPLQYYFELRRDAGTAWLYPGFEADLSNQPYFVVRQA